MRPIPALLTLAVLAATARLAHAGDDTGLLLDATLVKPIGGEGRVAESTGGGGEILILSSELLVQIGGYGVLGRDTPGKEARDIYDVHVQAGMHTGKRDAAVCLFGALGLDVLSVTTRRADETLRGTTLGVSAQAGLLGSIGERGLYRVSAAYLGAIVPGTGDDLGGVVLQLGLGAVFR